jgi:SAM-dependent methyltransferase
MQGEFRVVQSALDPCPEFVSIGHAHGRLAALGSHQKEILSQFSLWSDSLNAMSSEDAELQAHYAQGKEWDRLGDPTGAVELERTKEILRRRLPAPPAVVADIGGGPGRYALWLAELGYTVEHRDLIRLHVQQLQGASGSVVHAEVGDARDLNLADASVDAVLLLGPLYHLRERSHRVQALREAGRIVRPGGRVFAAVISRWAPRLEGVVAERLYESYPDVLALLPNVELTGNLPPVVPDGFSGYTHRPAELVEEIAEAELALEDLVGVEGMPLAANDIQARLVDPADWRVVLDAARAIERVPELLGLSPHLIATARRSPNEQPR